MASLYLITWLISETFTCSILCIAFYIVNRSVERFFTFLIINLVLKLNLPSRENSTRVDYAIPLRENFAIPFIYIQILFTSIFLKYFHSNHMKIFNNQIKVFIYFIFLFSRRFNLKLFISSY